VYCADAGDGLAGAPDPAGVVSTAQPDDASADVDPASADAPSGRCCMAVSGSVRRSLKQ
jgi:hypothetical protein